MPTTIHTDMIGATVLALIILSWMAFAAIFLLRTKPAKIKEAQKAPAAITGIALQGVGFGLVWTFRRTDWWPFPSSLAGELLLAVVAVALAWVSNWWCLRAVRVLGKQWTLHARVIQGHELITEGPYGIVRNPIYLGMFGLMVATGLALAAWWALLGAVAAFLIGNLIRIRAEEKLLQETFGEQFSEYARRVPAFLPPIW